jgi:magnesium transporter
VAREAIIFRPGALPAFDSSPEQLAQAASSRDQLLWIDLLDPTREEIDAVARDFELHPLAHEDAHHGDQRPKLDQYGQDLFIVFYALALDELRVSNAEIHFYVTSNAVISIHDRPVAAIEDVRRRWSAVQANGSHTAGMLLYALLDAIVDDYFPVVDHLSELLETAQEQIFEEQDTSNQQYIFHIIRTLVGIRRVLGPERDVMNALVRRDIPIIESSTIIYFQDVYDHILRVSETIDTYRDLVSGAIDVQLAITSNRLNEVMKRMTALSIILMSVTLIASIYGMNFARMPELDWHFGYPLALGTMGTIAGVLYLLFRRIDYL